MQVNIRLALVKDGGQVVMAAAALYSDTVVHLEGRAHGGKALGYIGVASGIKEWAVSQGLGCEVLDLELDLAAKRVVGWQTDG